MAKSLGSSSSVVSSSSSPARHMAVLALLRSLHRRFWLPIVACCLAAAALPLHASAAFTVTDTSDSSTDTGSLRYAITQANASPGSTITFAAGLNGTITLGSALPAITQATILSGPGANLLTVSGSGAYSVFTVKSPGASVVISGLTIANGVGSTLGANTVGGGIANLAGSLTVSNCTFTGNSAALGGAVYSQDALTVSGSTLMGNSAVSSGGALYIAAVNGAVSATLTGDTFYNNTAANGGAVYSQSPAAVVTLGVTNVTFYGNAAGSGADLYNQGGALSVGNSVLAAETGSACAGSGACPAGGSNGNVVGAANLTPLGFYGGTTQTLLPLPGSAAICAGSSSAASSANLTADQRGWPVTPSTCPGGAVDAGAVQTNYLTVTTLADQSDATPDCTSGTGNTCSLRDAVGQANTLFSSEGTGADIQFLSGLATAGAPGTITVGSVLPLEGAVNIAGPGASALTVSGNNASTVFGLSGPGDQALLANLTVTQGNTTTEGGCIYNAGSLTILDSVVSSCVSSTTGYAQGGAIYSSDLLNVVGTTVSSSQVVSSGALAQGGGIFNTAILTLNNSTLTGNSANASGEDAEAGGLYNVGTATIIESTVGNNSANATGSAYAFGGGVINNGTLSAFGVTISGNTANAATGGLAGGIASTGTLNLANSIVAGNTATGTGAQFADIYGAFNPATGGGNLASSAASAVSLIDIQLSPVQLNGLGATLPTMIPLPGSPAICAGLVSGIPAGVTRDERGFPNTNSSYSGYSSSPCVDAGAVQTNYSALQFAQQPTNTLVNTAITPSPAVEVLETNTALTAGNTDSVSGVPVTLSYSGGSGEIAGTLTATSAPTAGGASVAVFSGLTPNTAGLDFSFAIGSGGAGLAVAPGTVLTLTSNTFTVTSGMPTFTYVPAPNSQVYGTPIAAGSLDATATLNGNPAPGAFIYTTAVNGSPQTLTSGATILPAGQYTITAAFTPGSNTTATSGSVTAPYTVTKASTTTSLSVSSSTLTPTQSVTLTAKVASAAGVPAGSVSFYDGSTLLVTETLSAGQAVYTTTLPAGSNSLTAAYAGNSNLSASTSSPGQTVTVSSLGFTLAVVGSANQVAVPGSIATWRFQLSPTGGAYPGTVNFSLTGLPATAVATFRPATVAANAGPQSVILTVQDPTYAANTPLVVGRGFAPVALALLLLPFGRRLRKGRAALSALLLMAALFGSVALIGCGVKPTPTTFNGTVVATSGSVKQSVNISLNVY